MISNKTTFLFTICLIVFFSSILLSQNKQDYIWHMTTDQEPSDDKVQAFQLDFNTRPLVPSFREGDLAYDNNKAIICDENGEVLISSNGCAVANKLHQMMPNGDSINAGDFFDGPWDGNCKLGYPGIQDILLLNDPANDYGYYLIHKTIENVLPGQCIVKNLLYSYIDLSLDNGLGDVTIKNEPFTSGECYLTSYLSAIKHENKEDWWIINPGRIGNNYYTTLLTAEGFMPTDSQSIGTIFDPLFSGSGGNARFSPDGKKYALFSQYDGLLVYDFDRSTGQLSNLKTLYFERQPYNHFTTSEFSPNSRFLYLSNMLRLWQVDLWEENLEDGLVFIDEWDGTQSPFPTNFFQSALAPDCKIYLQPSSSAKTMHVIHYPDKKGEDCEFVQNGLQLQYWNSLSFPNFPRFRVDEAEKCDSSITLVNGNEVYWRKDLKAYPNPAINNLTIELPDGTNGEIFVLDMNGQIVLQIPKVTSNTTIEISHLPLGIYSAEFLPSNNQKKQIYTARISISH